MFNYKNTTQEGGGVFLQATNNPSFFSIQLSQKFSKLLQLLNYCSGNFCKKKYIDLKFRQLLEDIRVLSILYFTQFRLEDLFEKSDMKMETWDLKVAKS